MPVAIPKIKASDYCNSELFKIPSYAFSYSPKVLNRFTYQGEALVDLLIAVAPNFHLAFNKIVPLTFQKETANRLYQKVKEEYLKSKQGGKLSEMMAQNWDDESVRQLVGDPSFTGQYFLSRRNFNYLVPTYYKRSVAPRLTTTGSTFHGMKKSLKILILKEIARQHDVSFMDLDMGACHSRVAASLVGPASHLALSLKDGNFWDQQTELYYPPFESLKLSKPILRKMLKVSLYTSLNGGNPSSDARVFANLKQNAPTLLKELDIESLENAMQSSLFQTTKVVLDSFSLAKELKDLNKVCFDTGPFTGKKVVYAPNRVQPYEVQSAHLGISRLLQGFEVVLLTVLVREVLRVGGLPVSLDHDGVLAMFKGKADHEVISQKISQNLKGWAEYLLNQQVPIDAKETIYLFK